MRFISFESSTHTSQEAANAIGCAVSHIIKTLILESSGNYFILILCGDDRVDYAAVKSALGLSKRPSFASPEKVIEISGSPIGGVKPIFETDLNVLMDQRILSYDEVYGGGGDSNSVLEVTPEEIIQEMKPTITKFRL